MARSFKLIFLFLLFLLPLVSAVSIELKEIGQPQETVIAQLKGAILEPLENSDVMLKRGHVQVPFQYDLKKLRDTYFIYAILPVAENNYTLVINDIVTTNATNGQTIKVTLEKNISVQGALIPYTLQPGLILGGEDFTLTITLHQDEEKEITSSYGPLPAILLQPGENTIEFDIRAFPPGLSDLTIGDYTIPVYRISDTNKPIIRYGPRIYPESIETVILIGDTGPFPFRITNLGNETIKKVAVKHTSPLYTITPSASELEVNHSIEFNITLLSQNSTIDEVIVITLDDEEIELPLKIGRTDKEENLNTSYLNNYTSQKGYYCEELQGTFCSTGETCSSALVDSLNGKCCVGTCAIPAKTSYAWVGYTIGLVVLIVLIIIGGRYLKSKKKDNPLDARLHSVEKKFTS